MANMEEEPNNGFVELRGYVLAAVCIRYTDADPTAINVYYLLSRLLSRHRF